MAVALEDWTPSFNLAKSIKSRLHQIDITQCLTFPPINLSGDSESADADKHLSRLQAKRLEAVYLGASLVRHVFPDVQYVATGVLRMFQSVAPPISVRAFGNFVRTFKNVQNRNLIASNIPISEPPPGILVDFDVLHDKGSGTLVEIIDPD
jgi:hypothetical protein